MQIMLEELLRAEMLYHCKAIETLEPMCVALRRLQPERAMDVRKFSTSHNKTQTRRRHMAKQALSLLTENDAGSEPHEWGVSGDGMGTAHSLMILYRASEGRPLTRPVYTCCMGEVALHGPCSLLEACLDIFKITHPKPARDDIAHRASDRLLFLGVWTSMRQPPFLRG